MGHGIRRPKIGVDHMKLIHILFNNDS